MNRAVMWRVGVGKRSDGRVYVSVVVDKKRYRYANGEAIGVNLQPNFAPPKERLKEAELLKASFEVALRRGWLPEEEVKVIEVKVDRKPRPVQAPKVKPPTVSEVLHRQYAFKSNLGYSHHYMRDLSRVLLKWKAFEEAKGLVGLPFSELNRSVILDFILFTTNSPRAQKNLRLTISALLKSEFEEAQIPSPFANIRLRKSQETLHRPFENVAEVLAALKAYNFNLYLCCLCTYGLLLRPHQEVRNLTWGAFNADLSVLSLSGAQNKSQRNRIVPVPNYIRKELVPIRLFDSRTNVFTGERHSFSEDYFKGLWTKFKKTNNLIQDGQTIYSFRHSGAIEVFTRTNDLHLLSKLMGHSALTVTLTYLRGLSITTFSSDDLPHLDVTLVNRPSSLEIQPPLGSMLKPLPLGQFQIGKVEDGLHEEEW